MSNKKITFIDLFAGIGGFRLALESLGAECVMSSEIDDHAIEMYKENFGDDSRCDITELNPYEMPDFDILCAGFPCQTFSIAGEKKGFYDSIRGTLFFDICRILEVKKPKAFILENVKNLEKHDGGNTLFIMLKALSSLGYSVQYKILNAKDFGVPQNRERIILVGNIEGKYFDFDKLKTNQVKSMKEFLDKSGNFEYLDENDYTLLPQEQIKVQKSGLIFCGYRNKTIRNNGVRENTQHLSRVHKQPNRIYSSDGIHPTIASQEQSGRYFILDDGKVRKLTIDECYTFMGFPKEYKKIGSISKLYQRIGNSVCVPMIKTVADEMLSQFWNEKPELKNLPSEYLEYIYNLSINNKKPLSELKITSQQQKWIKTIVDYEETLKGVYTVLTTSLTYKHFQPSQDVRLHQANMKNGYSGRSFDTKYITPFLKQKKFLGAMKESGWLTRSLEQNIPYNLDFPGKINNINVKNAFLNLLNDIEENDASPEDLLIALFSGSIQQKEKKSVQIINPIKKESCLNIDEIINLLTDHFYYPYKSRGASILPVVALYSVYECIIVELKRFENKKLLPLFSHYSSDRSSGNIGDIVILNSDDSFYESIEVKFEIEPNLIMVEDAFKKFSSSAIQRYYILSTKQPAESEKELIEKKIKEINEKHGCQVIINGLIPTIKYYLRLLQNTDLFIENYIKNIQNNTEINSEHKIAWNTLVMKEKHN
ncbi:DNA cytosine methyltransferase [Mycoplasma sp. HF14]